MLHSGIAYCACPVIIVVKYYSTSYYNKFYSYYNCSKARLSPSSQNSATKAFIQMHYGPLMFFLN